MESSNCKRLVSNIHCNYTSILTSNKELGTSYKLYKEVGTSYKFYKELVKVLLEMETKSSIKEKGL